MPFNLDYNKALKAYRLGFGWGTLLGLIVWLIIGRAIFTLPLVLGLIFGAIAFQIKLGKKNKTETNVYNR